LSHFLGDCLLAPVEIAIWSSAMWAHEKADQSAERSLPVLLHIEYQSAGFPPTAICRPLPARARVQYRDHDDPPDYWLPVNAHNSTSA
jgi:hypothetical protein